MNESGSSSLIWAFAATLVGGALVLWLSGDGTAAVVAALGSLGAVLLARGGAAPQPVIVTPSVTEPNHSVEMEAVIEGISEPLLLCAGTKVTLANEAARKLLGQHIVGGDVRLAIRHPAAAERLTGPISGSDAPLELAGLGTRDQRWELSVAPLEDDGRVIHLSDRSGARAAERMRVDFVANASHELRTPLAAILGFVETLSDPEAGGDKEVRGRFLGIIEKEARRMQRLIDELMALSRIEAEKHRAPDENVDLGMLIAETAGVFHTSHGERGLEVEIDMWGDVPPVQGDRVQLSQLLHNLITNAVKYGRPGTPVKVKLREGPSGMATLSVVDEGEGIAPEHLPRLTERFYRVDSGRSRSLGGTGLGLAIVKHIVERHRGRLEIESSVGAGTEVIVKLPLVRSDAKPVAGPVAGAVSQN